MEARRGGLAAVLAMLAWASAAMAAPAGMDTIDAEIAARPENFAPEVRAAIAATSGRFAGLARDMTWGEAGFIYADRIKSAAAAYL